MNTNKFNITVFWSDEDESYVAHLHNLSISAFGETISESIHELSVAFGLLERDYNISVHDDNWELTHK